MAASTIKIKNKPRYAPGFGMSELVRDTVLIKKSQSISYADTSPIDLFELPGNVLVLSADVFVVTAFDASGTSAAATATITIPNDTGTETLYNAANVGLQSTGFHPSTAIGITPSSGGMLIVTYTASTTTAGEMQVYLRYVEYDDEL